MTGSKPANWQSAAAREYSHQHLHILADSIICQACRRDITRVLSDDTFVLRWNKPATETPACCVSDCHQLSHAMPLLNGIYCQIPHHLPPSARSTITQYTRSIQCGITHTVPLCRCHMWSVFTTHRLCP